MKRDAVIGTIVGVVAIVGTLFAMGDRYIQKATFLEFKERVIDRLDNIDNKLDYLIKNQP